MEKFDLKKLEAAIEYVKKIADGYDPVHNTEAGYDSVLNNPNVIRCMYFVKEVLMAVRCNDGVIGSMKKKMKKEPFPYEILQEYHYQEDKTITLVLAQIHLPAEGMNIKKVTPQTVTGWLKKSGYLTEEFCQEVGKVTVIPTQMGRELGIYTEVRTYLTNSYLAVLYNRNAQEFLVQNLEAIVNGEILA